MYNKTLSFFAFFTFSATTYAQQCLPPVLLSPAAQQVGNVSVSGTVRGDGGIVTGLISDLFGAASMAFDDTAGMLIQHSDHVSGLSALIRLQKGVPILIESLVPMTFGAVGTWIVNQGGIAQAGAAQLEVGGNPAGRSLFFGVTPDQNSPEYCAVAEMLYLNTGVNPGDVVTWGQGASHVVSQALAVANQTNVAGVAYAGASGAGQGTRVCRLGQVRVNAEAGIVAGDIVVTSGAHAGLVMTNNNPPPYARVGIATEATGEQVPNQVLVDVR